MNAKTIHQLVSRIQIVRFSPGAQHHRRGGNWLLCFSPGIDKENVELSPTTGHCNSGRTRHGSASQVQKQRSAGSFKRNSIKKIVWSFLSFRFQTDLTSTGSSLVTPHHRAVMLHFVFYNEPIQSAMLPDDQLLEALPKFNAAFFFNFFFFYFWFVWFKQVFRTTAKKVGGQDTWTENIPIVREDDFLNTATTGQLWKPFAQSSAFYVFPFFNIQSKVLVLFTHFSR